jgi:hypothetical protein
MLFLQRLQLIPCLGLIVLLSGCASFNSDPVAPATEPAYDPYAHSGIDELLAFGASMSAMSEVERSELCKSLVNTQKISPSSGKQLHLMLGRLLSDNCGDIAKIINEIQAIKPNYVDDERLQRFITINTLALRRLQNHSKKASVDSKPKKSKSKTDIKEATSEPSKDESRLLREKLEAMRTIEKQMDESVDSQ